MEKPTNKSFPDLEGLKINKLIVIGLKEKRGSYYYWECLCDCGNTKIIRAGHVKSGAIKSCGCIRGGKNSGWYKHGMSKGREYATFNSAKYRCENVNAGSYKHYGGKGIKFKFNSFEEFYEHIGPRPGNNYSIDRIDVEGNYEPGNVRWATYKQQSINKTDTLYFTYNSQRKSLIEWAGIYDIKYHTLYYRLFISGWSIKESIETPVKII